MAVWTVFLSLCLLIALRASVEAKPVGRKDCGVCPAKWSAYGCRCFRFFNNAHTWIDAENICLDYDGNLASVHSYDEYSFIQRLVRSVTNTGARAWIGGNDAVQEGHWLWSDGTKMNFKIWSPGNPSNYLGNEHCIEMNYDNGNWNDDHVSNKLLFRRRRRRHQGCTSALRRSHGHPSYAGHRTGAPGFFSRPYTGQIYPALNKTPRPVFAAPGKTPFFFPGFLLPLGRSDNPTYREMDLIAQDDPQAEQSPQGPKVACPVTTVVFPHRIRIASSIKTQQQAFSEPGPRTGFRHDTPASR
ncbi:unnamed protein product [Leuciscus chuanchicus]